VRKLCSGEINWALPCIPTGVTIVYTTGWDTGTSQAEVCGSDNGNAHASIDRATSFRVRLSHFRPNMMDSFFSKVFASSPKRPSVETTNGVK
jgi:hypothetical protein